MTQCVLFLAGRYLSRDFPILKRLCRGACKVAVDGGYKFFARAGVTPDIVIGDFDSLTRQSVTGNSRVEVIEFPPHKDFTDTALAVEHCLKQGAKSITLVQPSNGDLDHLIGNLLLPSVFIKSPKVDFRLISPRYEVQYLRDRSLSFSGKQGSKVSFSALSDRVTYSATGTAFNVTRIPVRRGDTVALRNRITAQKATFTARGEGLLIRLFRSRWGN